MAHKLDYFNAALRAAGAVLIRENTHRIYKLPNGRTLVTSKTTSDRRAEQNMLRDLKRLLRETGR